MFDTKSEQVLSMGIVEGEHFKKKKQKFCVPPKTESQWEQGTLKKGEGKV